MISNVLFQEVSLEESSITKLAEIVKSIWILVSLDVLEIEVRSLEAWMMNMKGGRSFEFLVTVFTFFSVRMSSKVFLFRDVGCIGKDIITDRNCD